MTSVCPHAPGSVWPGAPPWRTSGRWALVRPSRRSPFDQDRVQLSPPAGMVGDTRPPPPNRFRAASRFPGASVLWVLPLVPKGKGRGDRARGCCVGGSQGGKACGGGEGRWWWGALVNSNPAPGVQGRPHLPLKRERFKGERLRCVCARPPVRPPPVCAPVAVIADVPPLSLRCSRLARAPLPACPSPRLPLSLPLLLRVSLTRQPWPQEEAAGRRRPSRRCAAAGSCWGPRSCWGSGCAAV